MNILSILQKTNKTYHFYKLFFKNQKWTFINVQIPFLKKNPEIKKNIKNQLFVLRVNIASIQHIQSQKYSKKITLLHKKNLEKLGKTWKNPGKSGNF